MVLNVKSGQDVPTLGSVSRPTDLTEFQCFLAKESALSHSFKFKYMDTNSPLNK